MPERDIESLKKLAQLGMMLVPDQTPRDKLRLAAPAIRQAQDKLLYNLHRFR